MKSEEKQQNVLDLFLPYQKKFFLAPQSRKMWVTARQIGKSFTVGAMLVYKALEHGKDGVSLCISTGARAAAEIIRKAAMFAEAVKVLSGGQIKHTVSYDKLQFSTGARVVSLPGSADGSALRGWTAQCVCIDEAAFVPHLDNVLQAITPALSRDKSSLLVLTSTPAGKNGAFYDLFHRASVDPIWHLQLTTIHEAVEDGLDVDIGTLRQLCPDEDVFAQEYECQFAASSSGIIDPDQIVFEDLDASSARRLVGIDVGVKSDKTAVAIGADLGDKLWIEDIMLLDQMTFDQQVQTIASLDRELCFRAGQIDATGIGYGLSELISKQVTPLITPLSFTAANKTPMHEQLRADLVQRKTTFATKLKKLVQDDFRLVQRCVTDDGKVKYIARRDTTGHADSASAVVLLNDIWHKKPGSASTPVTWMPPTVFG